MSEPITSIAPIWRRFGDELDGFLTRRLPSRADAEDVRQDIFLRIQEGAARLEDVENVEAWLYTVARRAVADYYRARGRAVPADPLDAPDDIAGIETFPSDNVSVYEGAHDVHEEVLSWLRPLVEELPEAYRVPVFMADLEGRTQQEVADHLGLSLSGAKSRVQRGRALLGELLRRCCIVEFGSEGRAVAFQRRQPRTNVCAENACR